MDALLNWLSKDVPPDQFWIYIVGSIVLLCVFSVVVDLIGEFFSIEFNSGGRMPIDWSLFLTLLMAAFCEELIFRLPLALVVLWLGPTTWVILAALALSVIFGWIHGGFRCIFAQGVMGIVFCLVFLKCGGFQGEFGIAFWTVVLVHWLVNFVGVVIVRLSGREYIKV